MRALLAIALALAFTSTPSLLAEDPKPELFQAEECEITDNAAFEDDSTALGGAYVIQRNPYKLLVQMEVTLGWPSYTVWARSRGDGLQLHGQDLGEKRGLKTLPKGTGEWQWRKFGTFTAEEIGEIILVTRGPDPEIPGELDALLLAPTEAFDPSKDPLP